MRTVMLAAVLAFGISGASFAQPAATSVMQSWDTNGDGVITKDEWLAAEHPLREFTFSDTNHDGKVTLAELRVALKKARMARAHHRSSHK